LEGKEMAKNIQKKKDPWCCEDEYDRLIGCAPPWLKSDIDMLEPFEFVCPKCNAKVEMRMISAYEKRTNDGGIEIIPIHVE
jgi:hypothetical protein